MQIKTTINPARYNKVENGGSQQQQSPGQPPESQDTFQKSFMDGLASNPGFSKELLSKVGPQGEMVISATDDGIKIRNTGPSLLDRSVSTAGRILSNGGQEVVRVMNADPSFTFLASSKAAKSSIEGLVPRGAMGDFDKYALPAMRGVMLAVSGKRAISTFRNKDASTFEKVIDAGHAGTNLVGLVGELGKVGAIPISGLTGIAPTLATLGWVGDGIAVSLHAMGYITERGQVNLGGFNLDDIFTSKAAAREKAKAADQNPPAQG